MKNKAMSMMGTPLRAEYGEWNTNTPDAKSRYSGKITPIELKRRLKSELLKPYQAIVQPDHGPGVQIGFEEFAQTRPDGGGIWLNQKGQPLSWPDIFEAFAQDPSRVTLNSLTTITDDFRSLLGAMFADCFIKGFSRTAALKRALWSTLCYQTGVASEFDEIRRTWFQFHGEPVRTAEGETFPEGRLSVGSEVVRLEKRGINIKLTEEFVRGNPLSIIEEWLVEMGRVYQNIENNRAVDTLINGDLASGANAAPVIGVGDVSAGIAYDDFLRVWNRGDSIGENYFSVIANEDTMNQVGQIDEFRERQYGTPMVSMVNRPEPSSIDRFVSSQVPDNQVILMDRSHAMRQRVFIPIRVDRGFKPETWEHGLTIGYHSGYERVADKAVVVIDETLPFADNGFPSWFTVGGTR